MIIMTREDLDNYHANIISEINAAKTEAIQTADSNADTALSNITFATDGDIDALFEDW